MRPQSSLLRAHGGPRWSHRKRSYSMIAAAESSGCAAPDTGDVVVVDGPVADVDPKLGQFRGELHCLFRSAHRVAQEVL